MNSKELKNKIINITDKYDLKEASEKIRDIKGEKFHVKIAFLGEFKSGKSTLINALIGKNILPAFENPTTAVITEVSKADKNRYSVVELNEKGKEVERDIAVSEIANEVTNVQLNKKVIIKSNDINFLENNFVIIDTPGVSSIEECHDDVTYGYLPTVDVAFILVNINLGTAPKSLIDFLKRFPSELLSKIYFILNYSDQVEPNRISKLEYSFKEALTEVIQAPKVIVVSGKEALEAKLNQDVEMIKQSGIGQIESIILQEVVQLKEEIEEKRVYQELIKELKSIKDLLEYKITTLSWNTEEFDLKVQELTKEISNLKKELEDFEYEFKAIEQEVIERVENIVSDHIKIISHKASKGDLIDDDIKAMTDDLTESIQRGISRMKTLKLDSINVKVSQIIERETEKEISKIKDIADLITDIATLIVTAIIIPGFKPVEDVAVGGAAIAAEKAGEIIQEGEVIAEKVADTAEKVANKVDKISKNGKVLKVLGIIGKAVKEANPLEKLKQVALPYVINPRLKNVLLGKVMDSVDTIFSELKECVEEILKENYLDPISQREALIRSEREKRNKTLEQIDKLKENLEFEIREINKLLD